MERKVSKLKGYIEGNTGIRGYGEGHDGNFKKVEKEGSFVTEKTIGYNRRPI